VLGVRKGLEVATGQRLAVYFIDRHEDQSLSVSATDFVNPYLEMH